MAGGGLAAHQEKARDEGAHLVLIDASGFVLNPTARRTRAPRGRTPVLTGFGRHRDEVSVIAAVTVAPHRRRLGLSWRTDPEHDLDAAGVVRSLRDLLRHLRGKVIAVWDGGSNPKGPLVRDPLRRYPRLHLERLPGYAPDLNPVEMLRAYLEHGLMADFVPRSVRHLDRVVRGHLADLGGEPALIRSLWAGSKLPFLDKNPPT